jgi:hypothetical protein
MPTHQPALSTVAPAACCILALSAHPAVLSSSSTGMGYNGSVEVRMGYAYDVVHQSNDGTCIAHFFIDRPIVSHSCWRAPHPGRMPLQQLCSEITHVWRCIFRHVRCSHGLCDDVPSTRPRRPRCFEYPSVDGPQQGSEQRSWRILAG